MEGCGQGRCVHWSGGRCGGQRAGEGGDPGRESHWREGGKVIGEGMGGGIYREGERGEGRSEGGERAG